jgi:N4-gp56 family major capsid protein
VADAFTTTGSISTDTAAYDRYAYFGLRNELFYDSIADVEPTDQTHVGATVAFTKYTEMAAAITALSESVDVDAVAIADSQVTLTLVEYGNAVNSTFKARANSYIPLSTVIANLLGYNAGLSLDTIVENVLEAGTNVRYAGNATSRTTIDAADNLTAANVRRARSELRSASVQSFGGLYNAYIHPDIAYDFRGETGAAAWRDPHTYSQPAEIWNGEIGAFEGFRFIESPRAPVFANASDGAGGAGTVDVYATLFVGRQALAKAYGTTEGNRSQPRIVMGPVVDKLRRFQPIGWHHYVAYGIFRQEAVRRVEAASSIGTNT